jgi:hypothetical protein
MILSRRCISMAAAVAVLVAAQPESGVEAQGRTELRVLFIGNSYTYFNNLGDVLAGVAAANPTGPRIVPTLVTRGSATLKWHLENGVGRERLQSGRWDFVVLQEQSFLGAPRAAPGQAATVGDPSEFYASIREWVRLIRSVNATPILYMPWAPRETGPAMVAFTKKMADAHFTIGRELDVKVAPVGLAWMEASRLRTLDLHIYDNSHPTPAGSYLAACILWATLTRLSPVGARGVIFGHPTVESETPTSAPPPAGPYETFVDETRTVPLVDLRDATAAELQKIAWDVVTAQRQ